MVNNNKILTVSYGTFSCTLEGFDDSFSTMKAIAEYFRDLASDDRYFGAEPPQLDAEMMARIAQRQISSPVAAFAGESGIVLRAGPSEPVDEVKTVVTDAPAADIIKDTQEPAAEDIAQDVVAKADVVEAKAPVVETPVAKSVEPQVATPEVTAQDAVPMQDYVEPEVAKKDETAPAADSIAAKLQRIRAVVSRNEASARGVIFAEDENAEAFFAAPAEPQDVTFEDEELIVTKKTAEETVLSDTAVKDADDSDLDLSALMLDSDAQDEAVQVDDIQDDSAGIEETAASDADVKDADDSALDLSAFVQETDAQVDDVHDDDAQIEAVQAGIDDIAEETAASDTGVKDADDGDLDLSALMLDAETQVDDIQDDSAKIEDSAELDAKQNADDEIAKALAAFAAAETTAEVAADNIDDDDDLFGDDAETDIDSEIVDFDEDDELANLLKDVRDSDKTPQIPAQARVLKIKRKDFEAAIAGGQIETLDETTPDATAPTDESSLSDEDEAELLRELAEVEAEADTAADVETGAQETDIPATDVPEADVTEAEEDEITAAHKVADAEDPLAADFAYDEEENQVKSSLPPVADEDENDLSRLMDAADTKMEEPETSSRREAYSHLRAAVAVANAEHAAGGTVGTHTDDGAYREDLASVVRPRRPAAVTDAKTTERPSRPATGKPAPLKLVAEQRVDDQAGKAPRGPVRPRRVSAVQVDETHTSDDNEGGFVRFAQEMDATDLPDLLEAAAAYMSFVEGRAQFSRPQLMTKVRQIETSDFNREDGLRSFGKLLREGKIQKTGGGRFTASEGIGFRPDERAAG